MSKPTPAHHREVLIMLSDIAKGYAVPPRRYPGLNSDGLWIIVAAAPVTEKSAPVPRGMIRVIVAPAKVAP